MARKPPKKVFTKKITHLKGDNDETDEDVHHEEGDHDDVDDIEDRDDGPVVDGRSQILGARIDGDVQKAKELREISEKLGERVRWFDDFLG